MNKLKFIKVVVASIMMALIPVSTSFADGKKDTDENRTQFLVANYDVSNLKSYSPANSTILKDLTGKSPDFILINSPKYSFSNGVKALDFNNTKAQYGTTVSNFQGLDRFSVETYVKFSDPLALGDRAAIVTQAFTGQSVVGPSIFITGTTDAPALRLFGGYYFMGSYTPTGWSTAPLYSGVGNPNSGITLKENIWYHIALTFDASTLNLYINGVLRATNAGSGPSNNPAPLFIARRWDYFPYLGTETPEWASQYFFSGSISSVKIYSESLSASAIRSDYKAASERNEEGKKN